MKDFRKQKKELLRDDNKKCFLHYGATQQKAEKGTEEVCKRDEWEKQS